VENVLTPILSKWGGGRRRERQPIISQPWNKPKKAKNQLTGRALRAMNAGVTMELNLRLLLGALLLGRAAVEV
jgi:hypothetical protein